MSKKEPEPESKKLYVLISNNNNVEPKKIEVGKILSPGHKPKIKAAAAIKSKRTAFVRRIRSYVSSNPGYSEYYRRQLDEGRVFEIEIKVISECSLTDFMNTAVNTTDTIKVPAYSDDIIKI